MHTVLVIAVGLALLAACLLVGRLAGGAEAVRTAALIFLPIKKAGYSVEEEAPVFLMVFAVPALVALFLWWRLRASTV